MSRGNGAWADFLALIAVSRDVLNAAVLVDYLNARKAN